MALPTSAALEAAILVVFNALAHNKTLPGGRTAVGRLGKIAQAVRARYIPAVNVVISDATDASPTVAFTTTGQVAVAFGRDPVVGELFTTSGGTADFTDNALATAKSGAVASGDIYEVLSATTVGFVGLAAPVFTSVEMADYAPKIGA